MPRRPTSSNFSRCPPRASEPGGVVENRLAVGGAHEVVGCKRAGSCCQTFAGAFLRGFAVVSFRNARASFPVSPHRYRACWE